jgi:hypothetical protein
MPGCAGLEWCVPGGYVGHVPATTYISLTSVPFDTNVCNVEGCGLIADALNPLTK